MRNVAVGLNIANYTDSNDPDPRIGFAAGAEFEYQITKMFSLSARLPALSLTFYKYLGAGCRANILDPSF